MAQETSPSQAYTTPKPPPSPKKPFLTGKIILIFRVLLILLGVGGTYLALNSKTKTAPIVSKETPTSTPTPTPVDETYNWKTYTNNGGYSIKHPASWIIEEAVEENFSCALLGEEIAKAMTICFSTEKFSNVWPEYISNPDKIKITINGYDAYELAKWG